MTFRRQLLERAAARRATIVLPEGGDARIQQAAERLRGEGIATPLVLGRGGLDPATDPRRQAVADLLRKRRPDKVRDGIHALDLAADPLRFGAGLVALGEADGCVAGVGNTTADVLRAALWAIGPAEGIGVVSSAFYMVLPDDRVLTFTDCAVVPQPTPEQLAAIAMAAAGDRHRLVGDAPRVAFLSYSTRGSAEGEPVARVRVATEYFQRRMPGVVSDGKLQVDAALVPAIATRKALGSAVAGQANVLVFPNLDAGNIAYKLVERLAGAAALGPLLQGLARPMSDLSRGCSADDVVEVVAMVALQGAGTGTPTEES
ncbi:MAG: phosphate acyltransferase [Gemmatimonadales bacterium]